MSKTSNKSKLENLTEWLKSIKIVKKPKITIYK